MERSEALLGQLEKRMQDFADLVVQLRRDNAALSQRLEEEIGKQAGLERENADLMEKNAALVAQKEKTLVKLETLLARFNDSGQ